MVTVHYLDGQTLEGEIAAQDDLNIWLKVGDTPYLIHAIRSGTSRGRRPAH